MAQLFPGEDEMLEVLEVLALSEDPMFVIDDHHRIVFWNKGLQRLLGYSHDEVAGRSCAAVLAGNDPFGNRYCSDACPVHWIAQRGDVVRQFRLTLAGKDSRHVDAEIRVLRFTLRVSRRTLLAHLVVPAAALAAAATAGELPAALPAPRRSGAEVQTQNHADARVRELTAREIEILGMLASGAPVRVVSDRLGISRLTARNHIQHVLEKLEVHSRSEAVAFAYRMKLV